MDELIAIFVKYIFKIIQRAGYQKGPLTLKGDIHSLQFFKIIIINWVVQAKKINLERG